MTRRTVHLVAARGGHLELLQCVRAAFADYDRIWVTEPSDRAEALESDGERVEFLPHYGRSPQLAARNARAAAALVRTTRPEVVVCSGSGVTVPFCLFARAAGARLVYAETMARVTDASMTGRVLSRVASHVFTQWPDMAQVYRAAEVCRPALLESIGSRRQAGRGTFVAVGTWKQPFDRLLRAVDAGVGDGILPAPVRSQTGVSTYVPENYVATGFLDPAELEAAIGASEVVVCHAGSGILASALRMGVRPLVLPRLRSEGEHVDDHQLQIARRLDEYGLVRLINGRITPEDLVAARLPLADGLPADAGRALQEALAERLDALLHETGERALRSAA